MERTGEVGLIAVGGALGALVRFLVAEAFPSTAFPWSTFAVNLIGCALLALATSPSRTKTQRRVIGTGFCGGLTTFSTFAVEVALLTDSDQTGIAIAYLLASIAVGLAAFVAVRSALAPGQSSPSQPSRGQPL